MLNIINHGNVCEFRLNRPPVNALNTEMVKLLIQSINDAATDYDALVISGQDGVFSAGLDVVELQQLDRDGMTEFWGAFFDLMKTVALSPVPITAAITGHSPAGGAVICLMCDYRVMSRGEYKIGLNETRVGLIIPPVLQNSMSRLVGAGTAERMLVSGAMIESEEALKTGLVDALETGYEATIKHALQWSEKMLSLPPNAMLGTRAIARDHFRQGFNASITDVVTSIVNTWFSEETQTVMNALVAQLKSKR